ncbi:MAG: transcriptional regulator, TetR/AcrR family [Gammaproteobacteria bacterium]|jgi:TetR/AcrR family transcriptional repressor of nem operon|nr:transcriptional regulator, TetR/AcrR family [Gammaproteobacteria bacterium]
MTARKASTNHKNQIFEQARQLMRMQGYNRTSIADIAQGCGLSKASIYHHISEKKDLVGIAMRDVKKFFKENCFDLIDDKQLPSSKKIDLLFTTLGQYLAEYHGGCLVHNLVHELVDSQPEFLNLFQDYFSMWLDAITHIFQKSYAPETARTLAEDMVAQIGGAIMMDRLYRTDKYLQRVKTLMISYVAEKEKEAATA